MPWVRARWPLGTLLVLAVLPLAAAAQATSEDHSSRGLLAGSVDSAHRVSWRPLVLGSLGVILTGVADHEIRNQVRARGGTGARETGIAISRWTPRIALGIGAGLLGTGLGTGNSALARTGRDGLFAMAAAGVVTVTIKAAVGRARPPTERGTHYFVPFTFATRYNSFPSGHTSQAFALAAVIAAHSSRRGVRLGAYGAAGAVGLARVLADRHFASDVVAGAIVGTVVGRGVVRHLAGTATRATFAPIVAPGGVGLVLCWTW